MKTHELTDKERRAMRHAVGADAKRGSQGYRNRYIAGKGSDEEKLWRGLVARGLAAGGDENNGDTWFEVTRVGCAALGLSKAATTRACGSEDEQRALRERERARAVRRREQALADAEEALATAKRAFHRAATLGATDGQLAALGEKAKGLVWQ